MNAQDKAFPGSGMMIHLPFVLALNLMVYFAEVWYKKKYGKCRFEKAGGKDGWTILYDARKLKCMKRCRHSVRRRERAQTGAIRSGAGLLGDRGVDGRDGYYLEHHCFLGTVCVEGYTLIDLFCI